MQESRLQSGKTRMNSGLLPEKLRNMSDLVFAQSYEGITDVVNLPGGQRGAGR